MCIDAENHFVISLEPLWFSLNQAPTTSTPKMSSSSWKLNESGRHIEVRVENFKTLQFVRRKDFS